MTTLGLFPFLPTTTTTTTLVSNNNNNQPEQTFSFSRPLVEKVKEIASYSLAVRLATGRDISLDSIFKGDGPVIDKKVFDGCPFKYDGKYGRDIRNLVSHLLSRLPFFTPLYRQVSNMEMVAIFDGRHKVSIPALQKVVAELFEYSTSASIQSALYEIDVQNRFNDSILFKHNATIADENLDFLKWLHAIESRTAPLQPAVFGRSAMRNGAIDKHAPTTSSSPSIEVNLKNDPRVRPATRQEQEDSSMRNAERWRRLISAIPLRACALSEREFHAMRVEDPIRSLPAYSFAALQSQRLELQKRKLTHHFLTTAQKLYDTYTSVEKSLGASLSEVDKLAMLDDRFSREVRHIMADVVRESSEVSKAFFAEVKEDAKQRYIQITAARSVIKSVEEGATVDAPFIDTTFNPLDNLTLAVNRPFFPSFSSNKNNISKGFKLAGSVVQGKIGDCWLLSALSSLASLGDGDVVTDKLIKETPSKGVYLLEFYPDQHTPSFLILDTKHLPASRNEAFKMGGCREGGFWVSAYENAFVKTFPSKTDRSGKELLGYSPLCGGFSCQGMAMIDGGVGSVYVIEALKTYTEFVLLFDFIAQLLSKQNFVCCGSHHLDEAESTSGIASGHAYSILDAFECHIPGRGLSRFLLVRNPWGEGEWKGSFADGSSDWTSEVVRIFAENGRPDGALHSSDGLFWIPLENFVQEYRTLYIYSRAVSYDFAKSQNASNIADRMIKSTAVLKSKKESRIGMPMVPKVENRFVYTCLIGIDSKGFGFNLNCMRISDESKTKKCIPLSVAFSSDSVASDVRIFRVPHKHLHYLLSGRWSEISSEDFKRDWTRVYACKDRIGQWSTFEADVTDWYFVEVDRVLTVGGGSSEEEVGVTVAVATHQRNRAQGVGFVIPLTM
eukprot:GDKJ01013468.1.p1 GENE.GDKJ01013468.1~~GDKJ01013468.1.p1  ORF type:complete len:896 (-),score=210.24 GDKJ01013468.1:160-2847(-)